MSIKTASYGQKKAGGFTVVELLVVVAIILVLTAVVVLIMNPTELVKRSNDSTRLSDMSNLQNAITMALQEATNSGTASILCTGPAPCQGNSYTGTRSSDGTGWIKVNLSSLNSASMATLPVDPINDSTYNYKYYSDGTDWEIDCKLESAQQMNRMSTDGGDNPNLYEIGTKLTLMH